MTVLVLLPLDLQYIVEISELILQPCVLLGKLLDLLLLGDEIDLILHTDHWCHGVGLQGCLLLLRLRESGTVLFDRVLEIFNGLCLHLDLGLQGGLLCLVLDITVPRVLGNNY